MIYIEGILVIIPTRRISRRVSRCISRWDICVQVTRAQTALEALARRQCYGLNKQCDARSNWYDDWRYSDQHCCSLLLGVDILLVPASIVQVVHWPSVFTDSAYVFVSDANAFGQSAVCLLFWSSEHCVCVCVGYVFLFGIIAEIIICHPRTNRAEVRWASWRRAPSTSCEVHTRSRLGATALSSCVASRRHIGVCWGLPLLFV